MRFTREQLLIGIAFIAIYFIWGSTYLANYWAIHSIPPFLMGGLRFLIAGGILLSIMRLKGRFTFTTEELKNSILLGFLFITVGTGGIVWSEKFLDSSLVALIVTLEPLLIVLLVWFRKKQRPSFATLTGITLGFLGIIMLIGQPNVVNSTEAWLGLAAVATSVISWSYGAVIASNLKLPHSSWTNTGLQMLSGGFILLLIATVIGEWSVFDPSQIDTRAIYAWIYLIFAGAIGAFTAFQFLLRKVPPHLVATSNYINPIVALFLGWSLNNETISSQALTASVILVMGVFLLNMKTRFHWKQLVKFRKSSDLLKEYYAEQAFRVSGNARHAYVTRVWKAALQPNSVNDYLEFTDKEIEPSLRQIPGFVGYKIESIGKDKIKFNTYWEDANAMKTFSGSDYKKSVIFPGEEKLIKRSKKEVKISVDS